MNTTGYSPTAAAIAQSNASAQNAEMISDVIERGQANLANTVMPGEWYGGQLHIQPLAGDSSMKNYTITVQVGSDRHEISIAQGNPK